MAVKTGVLNDIPVETLYFQRFRKITRSKGYTVIPSINGLHHVFTKKIPGSVAVIAGSRGMVAGADPYIIMLSHDVAVFAGYGIIL